MQAFSLKNPKAMLMAAACAAVLTACGQSDDDQTSTLNVANPEQSEGPLAPESALFSPGDFELFKKPFHEPSECEVVTQIQLVNGFAGPMTALNEEVLGLCEIYVEPNGRAYDLKVKEADCGSKTYVGVRERNLDGDTLPVQIEITDNRERACSDRVAPLVVKETYADGHVAMRYAPVTE